MVLEPAPEPGMHTSSMMSSGGVLRRCGPNTQRTIVYLLA
jgi:hypothetical protein